MSAERSEKAQAQALAAAQPGLEVIRSSRRRRTVSAYRDGDRTVVRLPAGLTAGEEQRWIEQMLSQLDARDTRRRPNDETLADRAEHLRRRYLPEAARPKSVRWVTNQNGRWGSCTVAERTIRISDRLAALPKWVLDYVLVHELAHLVVADHDAAFWALVDRYPQAARARGFLEGYAIATARRADNQPAPEPDAD